jgi:hypothetical protein
VGTSPFGAPYLVWALVDATHASLVRTVVIDSDAMLASKLEQIGVPSGDAAAILGLKQEIAREAQGKHNVIAGTVAAATYTATGVATGWTHNLTAWFTGAAAAQPTRARATVMIGFPELGDNCPNPPCAGQAVKYEDCVVVQATCAGNYASPYCPNGSVVTPSCPAGKVEAGSYPHCGHHQTVFSSTDVGSVTLGTPCPRKTTATRTPATRAATPQSATHDHHQHGRNR